MGSAGEFEVVSCMHGCGVEVERVDVSLRFAIGVCRSRILPDGRIVGPQLRFWKHCC